MDTIVLFHTLPRNIGFFVNLQLQISWPCFWPLEHLLICDHILVTHVPPWLRSQSERWNPLAYGRITPTCWAPPCLSCYHLSFECLIAIILHTNNFLMFGLIHRDSLNNNKKKIQQTSSQSGNLFLNLENGFLMAQGENTTASLTT